MNLIIITRSMSDYGDALYHSIYKKLDGKSQVVVLSEMGLKSFYNHSFSSYQKTELNKLKKYKIKLSKNFGRNKISGFLSRINPFAILDFLCAKNSVYLIQGYTTFTELSLLVFGILFKKKIIYRGESVLPSPIVHAVSNNQTLTAKRILNAAKSIVKSVAIDIINRASIGILYTCQGNKEFYLHYNVHEKKLLPFYSCIDVSEYEERYNADQAKDCNANLRKQLNIPKSTFVISACGRLVPEKNWEELLLACSRYQSQTHNHDIIILFIGDGPMKKQLQKTAESKEVKCIFTGYCSSLEASNFLNISNIAAFTSYQDRSPKAAHEAAIYRLPLIMSSGCGNTHELVINGKTGYSYQCGMVDDLADIIKTCIDNPSQLERMGYNSYLNSRQYTPDLAASLLADHLSII